VALLDTVAAGWRGACISADDAEGEGGDGTESGSGGSDGGSGGSADAAAGFYVSSRPLAAAPLSAETRTRLSGDIFFVCGASCDDEGALEAVLASAGSGDAARALATSTSPSGETPLHMAADAGRARAVRALIAAGALVDAREGEGSQTALHYAAAQGRAAAALALLDAGAAPHAVDADGATPAALFGEGDGGAESVELKRRFAAAAASTVE
jgi:hypothetical protein